MAAQLRATASSSIRREAAQRTHWIPTQVYGVNWQVQRNETRDAAPPLTDIWIDDVYFVE
jgi:hypothetical protein